MNTGLSNYEFGTKRNWRRWVWNRIKERVDTPVKKAKGFYLIGPNNADVKVAVSKKFKRSNLLGIDVNKECVETARDAKIPAAQLKLQEAVLAWKGKIDFINADFCCGFSKQAMEFIYACFNSDSVKHGTVISMNLLRGRDTVPKEIRENCKGELDELPYFMTNDLDSLFGNNWTAKSRALMVVTVVTEFVLMGYHQKLIQDISKRDVILGQLALFRIMSPAFFSYKSTAGNMVMDTVVFRWPSNNYTIGDVDISASKTAINKVAALKAVSTMRNK